MTVTINAVTSTGLVQTSDGSGVIKLQSNGVTTNALAWVNFNGTTSPGTIRSQYNVSSVTKNGTGDYTLNFTNTLADANYVAAGQSQGIVLFQGTLSTSAYRVQTYTFAGALTDYTYVTVAIFGN